MTPRHPLTRRRCLAGLAGVGFLFSRTARGAGDIAPAEGLTPDPGGTARALGTDGALILGDGRRVRLAAIRLPQPTDLPQDGAPEEMARVADWAAQARAALESTCVGRSVRPWTPEVARDRYGRVLAQVTLEPGGLWVQAELIARGLARVATMPGAAAGAGELLTLEAEARAAGRGLWRDPLYAPRAPDETWPWIGTFQIVRGTVLDAARMRSRIYLNFGRDWRRDFTVMVEHPRRAGLDVADLLDLERQFIQVRGWLFPTNGPMIALDHAAALETRVILG
ncbi:thermonuclease family protein [Rhodospira trueperi]|uniref:Endonuclease YncB, thermonuclease family n=1 Tax=Rhodospira trueperi TaxID=69960 RepID=A0A1G7ARF8_9PROT|nr:thermonuclease family protein [Rhodospira trueperi]SDE17458.1 Endonuclease YncB, thermonuclease family [Rhodospira trueperi]